MIRPNKRLVGEGIAAVLWCLLTLATDRLFFRYDWQTPAFFVYKALFVLLAFAVIHGAVTLVGNLRRGDAFTRRWLQWTLPYLAVSLVVLLIVWPGCWGCDDLGILQMARTLQASPWQHFLTSGAFILSLMFLPLPGGLVLIQNLLISGMVGCFLAAAETLARARLRKARPGGGSPFSTCRFCCRRCFCTICSRSAPPGLPGVNCSLYFCRCGGTLTGSGSPKRSWRFCRCWAS